MEKKEPGGKEEEAREEEEGVIVVLDMHGGSDCSFVGIKRILLPSLSPVGHTHSTPCIHSVVYD